MNEAYQRLREDLPARRAPETGAFPTDPKRVKAWVDALPRANQLATLRQLGEALESLRSLRLEGLQRLLALETLRPSVLEGMALLDKQLHGSTFPLSPGKAQTAEQLQGFERELALGYRLALVELCAPNGSVPFLKGAQAGLALERAIYHYSRELAQSYYRYRTPPAGSWGALNALYRFAQGAKLDDKPVDEPAERLPLSPRQAYAQALLLALSNPYRFNQREQAELWPVTRDFAAHVELHVRRPGEDAFAVAQAEDQGPGYLPEERAGEHTALLWLGLDPLRRALEAPLERDDSGPVHVKFKNANTVVAPAELLRRLRAGWSHAAARGHQRLSAGHGLDTVIGLSGLHYYLAGHQDFDTFMRQVLGVAGQSPERDRAVWAQGDALTSRVPIARARVLDQSLGGYRVAWSGEETLRARVGELVGVAVACEDDSREWMVGVIRWLRYDASGEVDAGLELLARRALAVGLRSLDAAGVPRSPLRAIQIQTLRPDGNGALHFLAPAVLDVRAPRLEVARAADPDDFEEEDVTLATCAEIHVLENAGDYLLLAANPETRQ
jgi:hypothetical protein